MFKSTSLENSNGCGELQSRDKSLLCSAASASNRIQECVVQCGASVAVCWQAAAGQLLQAADGRHPTQALGEPQDAHFCHPALVWFFSSSREKCLCL